MILSFLVFLLATCATPGKKTGYGAGIGGAVGAGLGAIIGNQSGDAGKGALIGGALGGLLGGAVGNRLDKQAQELAQIAETQRTENGILTKLKGDILFTSASSSLAPAAGSNIDQIASIIKKYPEDIVTIVGHTDADGSEKFNQSLSEKRARSVYNRMIASGISPASLHVVGAGEAQPVASNADASGKALNRRVELQITVDPSKVPH